MSVYRTTKGWGVDWRDEFGLRHRRVIGEEQAARRMDRDLSETSYRARAALRNYRSAGTLNMLSAVDLFLAHLTLAPKTVTNYRDTLHHVAAQLNNPPLLDVTPRLLQEHFAARAQALAPNTLAKEAERIRALFAWLAAEFHIPVSPAAGIKFRELKHSTSRALTPGEELRILSVCSPRIRTKVLCGFDAGLRIAECSRLRRNHLNFDTGWMHVVPGKTRTPRNIPLTPRLHVALAALCDRTAPDTLVFNRAGRWVRDGTQAFREIRPRSGVKFHFHELRHSFATRLASFAPPAVVRTLLGHAPHSTTDLYVHPTPQQLQDAILELAEFNAAGLAAEMENDR
jgi:integrase